MVPGFLKQEEAASRRQLLSVDKLDVTRDIMEISVILNSEVKPEKMQFFIELKSWTETEIVIAYNFSNPLLVSTGIHPDSVLCKIKERKLFRAQNSNETLKLDRMYI